MSYCGSWAGSGGSCDDNKVCSVLGSAGDTGSVFDFVQDLGSLCKGDAWWSLYNLGDAYSGVTASQAC